MRLRTILLAGIIFHLVLYSLGFQVHAFSTPQLNIVSPSENQTVLGSDITISFIVGDLQMGKEGHLHLWLDHPSEIKETATEIPTHFDYELEGLPPGKHRLTMEVVKPDHTSFDPQVKKSVIFTTQLPALSTAPPSSQASQNIFFHFIKNPKILIGTIAFVLVLSGVSIFLISRKKE